MQQRWDILQYWYVKQNKISFNRDNDVQAKNALVKIFNKYVDVTIYGQTITKGHNFLSFKLNYNLPEKIESAINKRYLVVKEKLRKQKQIEMEREVNALEKDLIG